MSDSPVISIRPHPHDPPERIERLRFGMFVEPCDIGTRYCYRLVDLERGQSFEVGFIIPKDTLPLSYIDPRPSEDARCMHNLWEGLKRNSPGTFLAARNAGWINPASPDGGAER